MKKLEPFLRKSNATSYIINEGSSMNASSGDATFTNLDSDIYIFHSSDLISLFRLKVASKEVRNFLKHSREQSISSNFLEKYFRNYIRGIFSFLQLAKLTELVFTSNLEFYILLIIAVFSTYPSCWCQLFLTIIDN